MLNAWFCTAQYLIFSKYAILKSFTANYYTKNNAEVPPNFCTALKLRVLLFALKSV